MPHETEGLPDTYYDEEVPMLRDFIHEDDKQEYIERAEEFIKRKYLNVNFGKLGPKGFSKKPGNETTIVSFGPKGGETTFFREDGNGLLKSFIDKNKKALGPTAESIIEQEKKKETRKEEQALLKEEDEQLKEVEKTAQKYKK